MICPFAFLHTFCGKLIQKDAWKVDFLMIVKITIQKIIPKRTKILIMPTIFVQKETNVVRKYSIGHKEKNMPKI